MDEYSVLFHKAQVAPHSRNCHGDPIPTVMVAMDVEITLRTFLEVTLKRMKRISELCVVI